MPVISAVPELMPSLLNKLCFDYLNQNCYTDQSYREETVAMRKMVARRAVLPMNFRNGLGRIQVFDRLDASDAARAGRILSTASHTPGHGC